MEKLSSSSVNQKTPKKSLSKTVMLRRFLYIGLGIKRWLLAFGLGISILSIGLAVITKRVLHLVFPNFLPWYGEAIFLILLGLFIISMSIYGLFNSIKPLFFSSARLENLANTIYVRRSRSIAPKIVAIGGGTGLSVLLRGLKNYTDNISGVVTVADDGGSSGRLRQELGMPPPGDFRKTLVAMSDSETLLSKLFQYRFDQGYGLEGHSFGNLFIAAMTNVTGSFEQALQESSQILAVRGKIFPSTAANLQLSAQLFNGTTIHGESSITEHGEPIDRVFIDPIDAIAYPKAVSAIEEAHLIVIGPGSLYTSILPNLLVSGITNAIEQATAPKIYVCNVATQKGETDKYVVADHVESLQKHTSPTIVDYVIINDTPRNLGANFLGEPVVNDKRQLKHVQIIEKPLVDDTHPVRHDSVRLAHTVMDVYHKASGTRFSAETVGNY